MARSPKRRIINICKAGPSDRLHFPLHPPEAGLLWPCLNTWAHVLKGSQRRFSQLLPVSASFTPGIVRSPSHAEGKQNANLLTGQNLDTMALSVTFGLRAPDGLAPHRNHCSGPQFPQVHMRGLELSSCFSGFLSHGCLYQGSWT